jgi:hypothetical protein
MARKLKKAGVDINAVQKAAGLTKTEINKLK